MSDSESTASIGPGIESWYWDMGLHGALALLMIVLIVLVLLILARSRRGARGASALTVLEDRFARGEIKRGEYLERKQELS